MPYNRYIPISEERFNLLINRYRKFQENVYNPDAQPISVFDPLPKNILDELEMIREVSRELALKKDEDLKKDDTLEAEAKAAKAAETPEIVENNAEANDIEKTPKA